MDYNFAKVLGTDGIVALMLAMEDQGIDQDLFLLSEWTEEDYAVFKLGAYLELWPNDSDSFFENKEIFTSSNALGKLLLGVLDSLVRHKFLTKKGTRYITNVKDRS